MPDYTNPYLMPGMAMPEAPTAPDKWSMIANTLVGLGSGISQASANRMPWTAGLAPGAAMAMGMNNQAQRDYQTQQEKQRQYAMMANYRQSQEEMARAAMRLKEEEARRKGATGDAVIAALGGGVPGMNVQANPIQMGPPNLDQAGFVNMIAPHAMKVAQDTGLDPRLVIAQAALETGYGKAAPGNNYFGIKGPGQTLATQEAGPDGTLVPTQASFRTYADPAASANDYAQFIKGNPRYAPVLQAKGLDAQIDAMGKSVYATDPNYATKLRQIAQAIPGDGIRSGTPTMQGGGDTGGGVPEPQIDPQTRALIGAIARSDPEKAAQMMITAKAGLKKEDSFYPLGPDDAKMFLGPAYDGTKAYQRNRVTGKIEQIGGGGQTVNIDNKQQGEFAKEMGKLDAKRFGTIIEAEGTLNDMASKVGFAIDQLKQTYTGPAGETANALFKVLGAAGVEGAKDKANAADAAMAVISQMKPYMRASGSGASSDKDMDMFARALPSLANMPGGNERIAAYFQRLADRATEIRQLAQEHSEGGKTPLTGTKFDDAVKKLGPLFTEDERKEMQGVAKAPANRPPLSSFGGQTQGMTPMPNQQRPPLGSFGAPR